MYKTKKFLTSLAAFGSVFTLAGCSISFNKGGAGGLSGNTIANQSGNGNTQARAHVIYFNHIDGEGNFDNKDTVIGKLPATVTFEYPGIGENYSGNLKMIRYQVQYIACNCRSADFNAWSTMYVELSATKADLDNPNGSKIVAMSYGDSTFTDDYGHYTGVGHWGDSYAMDHNQNPYASEYAKTEGLHGATYHDFQAEILPFLVGTTKETLHGWMTNSANFNDEGFFEHENIQAFKDKKDQRYTATLEGTTATSYSATTSEVSLVDAYAGASVSLDNMLSVLDALFEYHTDVLAEIKKDPNNKIFYDETPLDFTGTYHLEKQPGATQTVALADNDAFQALLDADGTYMIYAAKEGCATCAAFSKAVNGYVRQFGVKIYETLYTYIKDTPGKDGNSIKAKGGQFAPQLFLVHNGNIVARMADADIDNAAASGSYLMIYNNFTKTLLAE